MHLRDFDAAEKIIEKTLQAAPDKAPVHFAKARLLRRTGKPTAEKYITDLLEKYPSSRVDAHLELGRLYRQKDRFGDAQKELEKAIKKAIIDNTKSEPLTITYVRSRDAVVGEINEHFQKNQ